MCKGGVNMIQALNSNLSFKGSPQETPEKKANIKDALIAARDVAKDAVKGYNNITGTAQGVGRGLVEGTVAAGVIGLFGKNIKNSQNSFFGTFKGIGSDTIKGIGKALNFIPSLITKSPLENAKNLIGTPKKFFGEYLKGNKLTATLAGVGAVGLLAFRTIQGKMHANLRNANVDHKTNTGHVK